VPTFRYDGAYIADLFGSGAPWSEFMTFFRHTLDSLLLVPSPVRINLDQYPTKAGDSVSVSFDVVAVDSIPVTPRTTGIQVLLAVTEEYHRYAVPVNKWCYALRDYVPDGNGYTISLHQGDSLHFDWKYPKDPVYTNPIYTDVFVQVTDTLWVKVAHGDPPETTIVVVNTANVLQTASKQVVDVASVAIDGTAPRVWLGQNAPNPFTAGTQIAYEIGRAGRVRLSVYTPTGRLVAHLVDGDVEPGGHVAMWDGRDRSGRAAASGVYYYLLETQDVSRSGRMVLLK
jgi:FlgD Ig-like domain